MQTAMATVQSLMGQSKEQLQNKEKECKLLEERIRQVSISDNVISSSMSVVRLSMS